ncbi:MAG: hypothetical protein ACE5NA_10240, partial [Nitrospiraceae bacterium]
MHIGVTLRTACPTAPQQGPVPIEAFPAYSTGAGLDPQEHGFPFTTGFPDTHGRQYTQAQSSLTSSL